MRFVLLHYPHHARDRAKMAIQNAPDGYICTITEPKRNLEQSAKFHALCNDISKQVPFAGSMRTPEQWKILLVSGHAAATKQGSEMVPGLEGEFVNLRESTAAMGKARMSSLIEYALAYCADKGVKLHGDYEE